MIARYTHPEMGRLWSDQKRFETWLHVEIAAAEAMAEAGIVPPEAAEAIRDRAGFDVERISEIEQRDRKSTRLNSSHIQKSRMPSSA